MLYFSVVHDSAVINPHLRVVSAIRVYIPPGTTSVASVRRPSRLHCRGVRVLGTTVYQWFNMLTIQAVSVKTYRDISR